MTILGGPKAPAADPHGWVSGAIAQDRRTGIRKLVAVTVIFGAIMLCSQGVVGAVARVSAVSVAAAVGVRYFRLRRGSYLLHRSFSLYGPIDQVTGALDADMARGFADHGPVLISSTWVLVRAQQRWRAIRRDDLMGAELEQGGRTLRVRSAANPPARVRLPTQPQAAQVLTVMKLTLEQNTLVGWGPRPTVAWSAAPAGGPVGGPVAGPVGWVPVSPLLAGVAPNPFSVP